LKSYEVDKCIVVASLTREFGQQGDLLAILALLVFYVLLFRGDLERVFGKFSHLTFVLSVTLVIKLWFTTVVLFPQFSHSKVEVQIRSLQLLHIFVTFLVTVKKVLSLVHEIVSTFHILHLDFKSNYSEHNKSIILLQGLTQFRSTQVYVYSNNINKQICVNFTCTIMRKPCSY
jgi:hypothetical protein